MHINGWIHTSLIDYPDHIATVFFTGGCNFRCPMCHNADLVLCPRTLPKFLEEEIWAYLEKRNGKLTGVVVTGGEPTLQPDLADFLRRVRSYGYAIKLDTNGYRPDVLAMLLDEQLLDYVAMDIKAPPDKYAQLSGITGIDVARIERSITLLSENQVLHEFRTTVVPDMLIVDDIESLAQWLSSVIGRRSSVTLYLQQFRALNTLDPTLNQSSPYPITVLQTMAERARRWLLRVTVR